MHCNLQYAIWVYLKSVKILLPACWFEWTGGFLGQNSTGYSEDPNNLLYQRPDTLETCVYPMDFDNRITLLIWMRAKKGNGRSILLIEIHVK